MRRIKNFTIKWDRFVPTEAGVPEFAPEAYDDQMIFHSWFAKLLLI